MIPFPLPKTFLLAAAGLLGVVHLAGNQLGAAPDPADPCTFRVTADVLNVRAGPAPDQHRVDKLEHGEEVTATPNVVGGFRDLGAGRWAAHEFLAPAPGSTCGP